MARGLRNLGGSVAAPPYTHGPYTWDQHVTFTSGVSGTQYDVKYGCDIWYVDSGISQAGDGTSWKTAFATLQGALDVAGDYDTILIAHNAIMTCPEDGWSITQVGLKIFGCNNHPGTQSNAIKKVTGTGAMFVISADRVEIAGLCLSMRTAGKCIQIGTVDNSGGGIYQTYIHDCNIEGQSALYGIAPYDSTVDPVNLVVENNFFRGFVTACIQANGTRDMYIGNIIHTIAAGIGIEWVKNGADRACGTVCDNLIVGVNSTDVGINITNAPTAGTLLSMRNYIQNVATPYTVGKGDAGVCMNYISNATGGATFDPSP